MLKKREDSRARRMHGGNKPVELISSSSMLVVAARAGPLGIRIMKMEGKDGSRGGKKSTFRDVKHGDVSAGAAS
jgi:hypothetical protein